MLFAVSSLLVNGDIADGDDNASDELTTSAADKTSLSSSAANVVDDDAPQPYHPPLPMHEESPHNGLPVDNTGLWFTSCLSVYRCCFDVYSCLDL